MNTDVSKAPLLKLPADSAAAVERLHPWIYGPLPRHDAGRVVRLCDPRGRIVGWGLTDTGAIAVRVLGATLPTTSFERVVQERIARADALRFRVVGGQTDCWRVINGAGDGLPGLVVDRYGETAVLKVYSSAWEEHLPLVRDALVGLGWVSSILRRFGVRTVDGRDGAEALFGVPPQTAVVHEHGIRLLVRPWIGQKTGLFLDQREHRRRIGELSAGRRVANLFAYTGGFSVAAALGGASEVITVDIAPAAIEDAKEIFRLNDLDPAHHYFEVSDAFAWRPAGRLGLLVVDPPSLARGGRSRGAAASAYRRLTSNLAPFIERDGLFACSSCTAQLTWDQWQRAVAEGLADGGAFSWLLQSRAPADHPVGVGHPEGQYLKFAVARRS